MLHIANCTVLVNFALYCFSTPGIPSEECSAWVARHSAIVNTGLRSLLAAYCTLCAFSILGHQKKSKRFMITILGWAKQKWLIYCLAPLWYGAQVVRKHNLNNFLCHLLIHYQILLNFFIILDKIAICGCFAWFWLRGWQALHDMRLWLRTCQALHDMRFWLRAWQALHDMRLWLRAWQTLHDMRFWLRACQALHDMRFWLRAWKALHDMRFWLFWHIHAP